MGLHGLAYTLVMRGYNFPANLPIVRDSSNNLLSIEQQPGGTQATFDTTLYTYTLLKATVISYELLQQTLEFSNHLQVVL
jgi:hypothetical protein